MAGLGEFFLAGVVLANGPCLFICAPVIIPCISGLPWLKADSSGWRAGLKFVLVFSAFRLTAYALLGFFSVVVYRFIFAVLAQRGVYLRFFLGFFIVGVGVVYLLSNYFSQDKKGGGAFSFCGSVCTRFSKKSLWSMVILGLLIGFSPCPPLLAMLAYIAATAPGPWWGLLAGLVFGLGTIITPLIPLGVFAGFIVDKIKRFSRLHLAVRLASGVILIYFGARLIL